MLQTMNLQTMNFAPPTGEKTDVFFSCQQTKTSVLPPTAIGTFNTMGANRINPNGSQKNLGQHFQWGNKNRGSPKPTLTDSHLVEREEILMRREQELRIREEAVLKEKEDVYNERKEVAQERKDVMELMKVHSMKVQEGSSSCALL